jgi:hypothetical protein
MSRKIVIGSAKAEVVSEDTFRSRGKVNESDDMVRVTIDLSIRDWRRIAKTEQDLKDIKFTIYHGKQP